MEKMLVGCVHAVKRCKGRKGFCVKEEKRVLSQMECSGPTQERVWRKYTEFFHQSMGLIHIISFKLFVL